jgi:hypothetical protein
MIARRIAQRLVATFAGRSTLVILTALAAACGDGDRAAAPLARPTDQTSISALGNGGGAPDPAATEAALVQAYVDDFYKDTDIKHSFYTMFDERIDCIDFYAQRSVRQMIASGTPVVNPDFSKLPPPPFVDQPPSAANVATPGTFDGQPDKNGNPRTCPPGTVPSSRPTLAEIAAAGGLAAYKQALEQRPSPQQSSQEYDCFLQTTQPPANSLNYEHAAGYQDVTNAGASSRTAVYAPFVQSGEHSVSQIWVETGNCENWGQRGATNQCPGANGTDPVQSLEAGWIAYPNTNPELFVFSTQDGYFQKNCWAGYGGGCCPNGSDCWVAATNAPMKVNQQLPVSTQGSTPWELNINVWNGWNYGYPGWMVYINGALLGWYPAGPSAGSSQMFHGQMQQSATYYQVGGEVVDLWTNNQHTGTAMGSGSMNGYMYADYHRKIGYWDTSSGWHDGSLSFVLTPSGDLDSGKQGICGYDAGPFYSLDGTLAAGGWGWATYFYFGGN